MKGGHNSHGTFSGKQKKQILQARRKRIEKKKSEKGEKDESKAPQVAVEVDMTVEKDKGAANASKGAGQRGVPLIREIYGLRTVFAREPDDIVLKRRLKAQTEVIVQFKDEQVVPEKKKNILVDKKISGDASLLLLCTYWACLIVLLGTHP